MFDRRAEADKYPVYVVLTERPGRRILVSTLLPYEGGEGISRGEEGAVNYIHRFYGEIKQGCLVYGGT